jgi:hypothetical protein
MNVVFGLQIVGSCGLPEEMASIPLEFEEPVYGSNSLTFTDFMAPGIFNFFMNATLKNVLMIFFFSFL